MTTAEYVTRLTTGLLNEALAEEPVVLLHGLRQCGKTTLVRAVSAATDRTYVTFDDDVMRAAAAADPIGFVRDLPGPATLDEVQRVPELFTTLKAAVDRDRTPGRFLLTGSANVFAIPRLADSLAGRMAVLRLYPMAQAELARIEPSACSRCRSMRFGVVFDAQPPLRGVRRAPGLAHDQPDFGTSSILSSQPTAFA